MGKQKQQIISRFFAPKPDPSAPPPRNPPSTPSPKISTTVSLTPAKRLKTDHLHNKLTEIPNPAPTLHQKFLNKLLEPSLDRLEPSRITNFPKSGNPKYTPLENKLLLAYAGPASNVRVMHASQGSLGDGGGLSELISLYESLNESNITCSAQQNTLVANSQGNNGLRFEVLRAMPELVIQALALTIHHLKQFGFERILCLEASFRPFASITKMTLSANALQQLEVLKNNYDGSDCGSLLQCMNNTLTVFGSRLLRHWVTHPLCDRNMIYARSDAVSEILRSMGSSSVSEVDSKEENPDIMVVQPELRHTNYNIICFDHFRTST